MRLLKGFARRRVPTRVFVLCTGRCGSVTFARACAHLSSHTCGHESRGKELERLDYPDQHIEVDNRLSWFLGGLGQRFDPERTLYVHLTRDEEQVAKSFLARWDSPSRSSMIRAFSSGILMRGSWAEADRMEVCRLYARTVNQNIAEFISHQPLTASVRLETVAEDFPRFLDRIGAEGDLTAAQAEWSTRHNATREPSAG